MLDKLEKISNILVNMFIIFTVVFVFLQFNNSAIYTEGDHMAESGMVSVYMDPYQALLAKLEAEQNSMLDLTTYNTVDYDGILRYCANIDSEKIVITGTIYSVTKTSTAYTYCIADENGNYYNIIDSTSKFPKYNKSEMLKIYGVPYGMAQLNGKDIPSIKVNFLEPIKG